MRNRPVWFLTLGVGAGLFGCRWQPKTREISLPPSMSQRHLFEPDSLVLSAFLRHWQSQDWRSHWVQGLASEDSLERVREFSEAIRMHPEEPFLWYALSLEYLARNHPKADSQALQLLNEAILRDPQNGVLDLTRAVALTRLGQYARARAVFMDMRGFPRGDLYGGRMEAAILGLLETGLRLNPYDLVSAQEWIQKIPQPPVEEWSRALETIFLDPLVTHPYDIRLRGYQAAMGTFRLGSGLIVQSLNPDRVFSDGREERMLGLLLQVKAREFLQHFAAAFALNPKSIREWNDDPKFRLTAALMRSDSLPGDWEHFLSGWEQLGKSEPNLTLGQAVNRLTGEAVWRKVIRFYGGTKPPRW